MTTQVPNKDYEDAKYELGFVGFRGVELPKPYRFNEPIPTGLLGSTDGSLSRWLEKHSIPPFVPNPELP